MDNRWNEAASSGLSELDLLVYQSRLVGTDPSLVLWGGGNTSIKTNRKDFRGRDTETLLVKSSGADLATVRPNDFVALRIDDLEPAFQRSEMTDEQVVTYLEHCMMDPGSARPSIETLLHAFIPMPSVVHSHADAIVALTNTREANDILSRVFDEKVGLIEYMRPGFVLSKSVGQLVRDNTNLDGVVLMKHGLFTWGLSIKQAYDTHVNLVSKAEQFARNFAPSKRIFTLASGRTIDNNTQQTVAATLAPVLRGAVSKNQPMVLRYDNAPDVMEFVNSQEANSLSQVGPATPDHTLQTKTKVLWLDPEDPSDFPSAAAEVHRRVEAYAHEYSHWYQANSDGLHPMLDPYPRVILMPSIGMWTTGNDARTALIAADIYHHTIKVMKTSQAIGNYVSLSDRESYHVEYWPMELYKLTLSPTKGELYSKVALITGAAHGIGRDIARQLAIHGAHITVTDIDIKAAQTLAQEINDNNGHGRAQALALDVTDPKQVFEAFLDLRLTYGGLDILISNAGIAPVGAIHEIPLEQWQRSLNINTTGHFLVASEAVRLMRDQSIGGSIVFIGTKNVPSPGKDFGAYSAAKAAEVQLARVLAIENGEQGIRVNVVNPDAVFEGSGLWSTKLKEQRAKAHGIPVEQLEDFYRQRNLLKKRISGEDVAEAVLFLAGPRSSKTTGTMLPVDAGLQDAFPR